MRAKRSASSDAECAGVDDGGDMAAALRQILCRPHPLSVVVKMTISLPGMAAKRVA